MATAATLVLKDKADVNVNYYPVVIKTGEYAKYVDRTQGVLALQSTGALAYRETADKRHVSGTVSFPITVDAATGEVSHLYGKFSFEIDKRATSDNRLDLRKRTAAMIADAITNAAVDNGETPW